MNKTPRSEVSASLRDLIAGTNRLPWTHVIFVYRAVNVQSEAGAQRSQKSGPKGVGSGFVY